MTALLRPFFQICILRMRPQDLPMSGVLLGLSLAAYTICSIAGFSLSLPFGQAMLAGPLDATVLAVLTASLLYIQRLGPRMQQTLTALAGCGALLTAAAVPLVAMLGPEAGGTATGDIAAISLYALMVWSFAVTAHILRHAISSSFFIGLVIAIVFHIVSYQVLSSLFDLGGPAR